jgi:hypothetical protein
MGVHLHLVSMTGALRRAGVDSREVMSAFAE